MKLASLLVPTYMPRAYVGATPVAYQSGTVDAFERSLVKLCPAFTIRYGNATRLLHDPENRFVGMQIVTRYDVMVDPASPQLGDVVTLALTSFKLEKLTVVFDDAETADLALGDAGELKDGYHPWNETFPSPVVPEAPAT